MKAGKLIQSVPGGGFFYESLTETCEQKTREKGRNLEPGNPRVHAFRDNFSSIYSRCGFVSDMSSLIAFIKDLIFVLIDLLTGVFNNYVTLGVRECLSTIRNVK